MVIGESGLFSKANSAKDYEFKIDPKKPIEEQAVSDMASAIIITIFRDYFADENQRALLSEILKENSRKVEIKKREKYNPDKIFEKKTVELPKPAVIPKKKNIFQKILDFIKGIIRR